MTPFTIRPAETRDAERLLALVRSFVTSYQVDGDRFSKHFPSILTDSGLSLIVCQRESIVCGYCLAAQIPTLFANGPIVEILELMVEQGHRRAGIGRALVDRQVAWAQDLGCAEVVVPTRRAGAFYKRLGFSETATLFKLRF
jgi:N-acetylglutamate synthase-like GNAT family acetyltransferase